MTFNNLKIDSTKSCKRQEKQFNTKGQIVPFFNSIPSCNQIMHHTSQGGEQSNRKNIKIKRKFINYMHGVNKFLKLGHIYNIFDQLCINEQTIRNPENDESIFKTLFYMRTIIKLETSKNFVRIWVKPNSAPSNIPYIIQRFNSFGDDYFHSLANSLQNLYNFFNNQTSNQQLISINMKSRPNLTQMSAIQSFINSQKGKACFIKILPNQYIFSNSFIELIGGTVDNFAQECVRYRIIVEDFFTSENYRTILQHSINFQSLYVKYLQGLLSMEDILKASQIKFVTSMSGKNDKKIKVLLEAFMPSPFIFCILIDQVLSQELLMPVPRIKNSSSSEQMTQLDNYIIRQKEQFLQKMYPNQVGMCLSPKIQCQYAPKPKRRRRRSECDYDYQ